MPRIRVSSTAGEAVELDLSDEATVEDLYKLVYQYLDLHVNLPHGLTFLRGSLELAHAGATLADFGIKDGDQFLFYDIAPPAAEFFQRMYQECSPAAVGVASDEAPAPVSDRDAQVTAMAALSGLVRRLARYNTAEKFTANLAKIEGWLSGPQARYEETTQVFVATLSLDLQRDFRQVFRMLAAFQMKGVLAATSPEEWVHFCGEVRALHVRVAERHAEYASLSGYEPDEAEQLAASRLRLKAYVQMVIDAAEFEQLASRRLAKVSTELTPLLALHMNTPVGDVMREFSLNLNDVYRGRFAPKEWADFRRKILDELLLNAAVLELREFEPALREITGSVVGASVDAAQVAAEEGEKAVGLFSVEPGFDEEEEEEKEEVMVVNATDVLAGVQRLRASLSKLYDLCDCLIAQAETFRRVNVMLDHFFANDDQLFKQNPQQVMDELHAVFVESASMRRSVARLFGRGGKRSGDEAHMTSKQKRAFYKEMKRITALPFDQVSAKLDQFVQEKEAQLFPAGDGPSYGYGGGGGGR